jgi:hypothetical protein
VTGNLVEIAYVDQGHAGPNSAKAASSTASSSASPNIPQPNVVLYVAQTLGRREKLHLGRSLQKTRQRLRIARHKPQRLPLHRLRLHYDRPILDCNSSKPPIACRLLNVVTCRSRRYRRANDVHRQCGDSTLDNQGLSARALINASLKARRHAAKRCLLGCLEGGPSP